MGATIAIGNFEATIDFIPDPDYSDPFENGLRWTCSDKVIERWLNLHTRRFKRTGSDPNPPHSAAMEFILEWNANQKKMKARLLRYDSFLEERKAQRARRGAYLEANVTPIPVAPNTQTKTVSPGIAAQQKVVLSMLDANTVEEVREARRLRNEWLSEHPDDTGVWQASEELEITAEKLGMAYEPFESRGEE